MIIKPFETREFIFFRKTREALFYKLTEYKLNTVENEIDRLNLEKYYMKPGKVSNKLIENINENLEYLSEIKQDIIYFRLHGQMRSKKHSSYSKYYKLYRA